MRNKLTLLTTLLISFNSLIGQTFTSESVSLQFSETIEELYFSDRTLVLESFDDGTALILMHESVALIDDNFKILKKVDLSISEKCKKCEYIANYSGDEDTYILFREKNKKTIDIKAFSFNNKTLKPAKKIKNIYSFYAPKDNAVYKSTVFLLTSPDKEKRALFIRPTKKFSFKNTTSPLIVAYLDQDLNVINDHEVQPRIQASFIGKALIDNNSNVFQIVDKYLGLNYFGNNPEESILYHYNPHSKRLIENEISVNNKSVGSSSIIIDNEGNLIVVGTAKMIKKGGLKNFFYQKYFVRYGKMEKMEKTTISSGFKKKDVFTRADKKLFKKTADLDHYRIDSLVYLSNGNLLAYGEKRYSINYSSGASGRTTSSINIYNNVFGVEFNKDGEVVKQINIPKAQKGGARPNYISYIPMFFNDQMYFLYNESTEGAKRLHMDVGINAINVPIMATLGEENPSKVVLFDYNKIKDVIATSGYSSNFETGEIFLKIDAENGTKFGKITFK